MTGQSVFAGMLYVLGVFLAVFATGSQVPNLQRRGTVDLYLTRPITRTHLLLGRFLGAITLVTVNLLFLCGGVFVIISLKTGVWNPRFLVAMGLILVVFLSFLGFMYLVGVLSSSTPLSIMLPYALYMVSMPLAAHDHIAAAMDSRFWANVVHGLYWVLPKTAEVGRDLTAYVLGKDHTDADAAGDHGGLRRGLPGRRSGDLQPQELLGGTTMKRLFRPCVLATRRPVRRRRSAYSRGDAALGPCGCPGRHRG